MTGTIANLGTKVLKKIELYNTFDEKNANFLGHMQNPVLKN